MHWYYLVASCVFEVIFALACSASHGFTRFWPTVLTIIGVVGGVYTLSVALIVIDVSVGYTIFTGVGAIGAVIFGMAIFGEKLNRTKAICLASIITSVIGLKIASGV